MSKHYIKKILLLLTSILFLISGCATYIKVKLLKPSEVYIGSIKKVSVGDFELKGDFYTSEEKSLGEIAGNAILDTIFGSKDKDNDSEQSKKMVSNIYSKLNENGYFKILSSNDKDYEAIIKGSGIYKISDTGSWIDDIQEKNGIKITNKKYRITRKVTTFITYNVLDYKNTVLATKSKESSSYDTQIDTDPDTAKNRLRSWKNIADEQIDELSRKIVFEIAPHYEDEDREIKDGKSKMMKSALEYSKSGLMEEAKKIWEDVKADSKSEKEDLVNATYNLGIFYEIKGEFDKSIEYFKECAKITNKNDFFNDIQRINNRKKEIEQLKRSGAEVKN